MRNRSKVMLAALGAVLLLSIAVTTAAARRLEFSNTGFRAAWTSIEWGTENGSVNCPLTLEGTFHSRTISKVSGQLIGFITRAIAATTVPPCRGGEFFVLRETLPWHVRYQSFSGTLPRITSVTVQVIGLSILYAISGISCLLRSTAAAPAQFNVNLNASGEATSLSALETVNIPLTGSILCPRQGHYMGASGPLTLLGTTTTIRVRLVA